MASTIGTYFYNGLAIALVFGLSVFVHEFGHMFFALVRGVGVESFAIGMGPKICAWKWKGIEFSLRWFPVGGFVKLAGPMPMESAEEPHDGPQDRAYSAAEQTNSVELGLDTGMHSVAQAGEDDKTLADSSYDDMMALSDKGLLTKLLVFGGGVFMNYVTAIAAMIVVMMLPVQVSKDPMHVYAVDAGSQAEAAGLRGGDAIVAVDGQPVKYLYELGKHLADADKALTDESAGSKTLTLTVQRATEKIELKPLMYGHLLDQAEWFIEPVIGEVMTENPADRAGLKAGDRIVSIDGEAVANFSDIPRLIAARKGEPVRVAWLRGDEPFEAELDPMVNPEMENRWIIGIGGKSEEYAELPGLGAGQALVRAPGATWDRLKRLVNLNISFFKKASIKEVGEGMGGPVMIARLIKNAADKGLPDVINFFITLNLLLMVFNLLPLPVLDGGFIVVSFIEALIRKPVPPRYLAPVYTVFVVFFISLMLVITLWDVKKWIF